MITIYDWNDEPITIATADLEKEIERTKSMKDYKSIIRDPQNAVNRAYYWDLWEKLVDAKYKLEQEEQEGNE